MTANLSNKICSDIFLDNFLHNIPVVNKAVEEFTQVGLIQLLSHSSFTCLINLLMYWFDEYHVAFVCGKKYTQNMLKREWEHLHNTNNIEIIKELEIPYTKILLKNINQQCPESIINFNDTHGKRQGKIFGYFILCEKQFAGFGNNASHFFTNKNTADFFSKKIPNMSQLDLSFILTKINNAKKKCMSCVVGSSAIKLFGEKNIRIPEKTDIWDPETNNIDAIIHTINTSKIRNLRIQNKKIEWFDKCFMVPSHEINMVEDSKLTPSDFFMNENIFGYYMGIKFLYVGGNTSNIKIKECYNGKHKVPIQTKIYKPNKKHRITSVWNYHSYDITTKIYRDVSLSMIDELDLKEGFWIIEPSGILTIIASKKMFIPWLTRGFASAGKFALKGSSLHFFPCNKFAAACDIKKFLSISNYDIHLNGFQRIAKIVKKPRRPIKKKNTIIQDERQRDNLSSLFTLLSRN